MIEKIIYGRLQLAKVIRKSVAPLLQEYRAVIEGERLKQGSEYSEFSIGVKIREINAALEFIDESANE